MANEIRILTLDTSLEQLSSSNEVSGSAYFQIMELPAVRRTQPIAIGQNFFNNPCPIVNNNTVLILFLILGGRGAPPGGGPRRRFGGFGGGGGGPASPPMAGGGGWG